MALQLDHLVVAAATLEQGVAWCEATLGITPGPGGQHALMGTHNRLFALDGTRFPRAYFEIIAIDPQAPAPGRVRWFDLDDAALRASVVQQPRLVHWVARCDNTAELVSRWAALGLDVGRLLTASRLTPAGELRWQITVRDDGRRLMQGALPTLIEWGDRHPTDRMPASGVSLQSMQLCSSDPALLSAAMAVAHAAEGIGVQHAAAPALDVVLDTPRGRVRLTGPA